MQESHVETISHELGLDPRGVAATARLLEEGGTVPFISRYRKEATGSLDEVAITGIRDRLEQLAELDKRRKSILESLEERELLSPELRKTIEAAPTMAELEDAYLPFRPKRRTRATIAREKGLEPLAEWLLEEAGQPAPGSSAAQLEQRAMGFVGQHEEVTSVDDALAGARDIVAEVVSENADIRAGLREHFIEQGTIQTKVIKGKEEEGAKFRDYYDWSEAARNAPGHRILAMRRGESEKMLRMSIAPPAESTVARIERYFAKNDGPAAAQVRLAVQDSYKRLLSPSMETEARVTLRMRAEEEAIEVFASNLRELLLASPLGDKRILALDPGFRTGCKLVVLDRQGKLLHDEVIQPHAGEGKRADAARTLQALVEKHEVEAIAIGNGTAGRETEEFVRGLDLPDAVVVVMVNEAGASVYSASEVAREEFPDHDLTVRGAVSIGRRLMDPLAELVKIDPKSIGVGQYQHDVDQKELKRSLDDTVTSCVNAVGVDVNTASKQLLTYVSGLGPQLAENIVGYRDENGAFASRAQLKKVPRLGAKAFEQAAGFLRIRGGKSPLDASAVHPESYPVVKEMAKDLDLTVDRLVGNGEATRSLDLKRYCSDSIGLPTLQDILEELAKPGRDPRADFEIFRFAEGVEKMEDLAEGMRLPGIVTNVTNFGAFIDVGVHQDGLAHISQLADRFVRDPHEVVKVGQKVMARVLEVDLARRRISLSLKD